MNAIQRPNPNPSTPNPCYLTVAAALRSVSSLTCSSNCAAPEGGREGASEGRREGERERGREGERERGKEGERKRGREEERMMHR